MSGQHFEKHRAGSQLKDSSAWEAKDDGHDVGCDEGHGSQSLGLHVLPGSERVHTGTLVGILLRMLGNHGTIHPQDRHPVALCVSTESLSQAPCSHSKKELLRNEGGMPGSRGPTGCLETSSYCNSTLINPCFNLLCVYIHSLLSALERLIVGPHIMSLLRAL